jgi:hypothetical protein
MTGDPINALVRVTCFSSRSPANWVFQTLRFSAVIAMVFRSRTGFGVAVGGHFECYEDVHAIFTFPDWSFPISRSASRQS